MGCGRAAWAVVGFDITRCGKEQRYMKLDLLRLRNFRCFGDTPTEIQLDPVTAFIGLNGSGKTAALLGLCRLFGDSTSRRRVVRSDFHVPTGKQLDDLESMTLYVEAQFSFPEAKEDVGIPQVFRNMVIDDDGELIARVRLEATFTRGALAEGDIEERVYWIVSPADEPSAKEKLPMLAHQRDVVQVIYLPAVRDPEKELRYASGTLLNRLLRAGKWSAKAVADSEKLASKMSSILNAEPPLEAIHKKLSESWGELYSGADIGSPQLTVSGVRFEDTLRLLKTAFVKSDSNDTQDLGQISDGWRSLLYFALVRSVFALEQEVAKTGSKDVAFDHQKAKVPALTVFAVEEPENHLAPHFLAKVMSAMRELSEQSPAQVVLTSHSPAVMSRISPREVRHFQLAKDFLAEIHSIELPKHKTEEYKFVSGAVHAYPEMYFSRLVVLGEGESEAIVLPRIAASVENLRLDPSFVSFVPLGGRHVHHLWKLLRSLAIPHLTLLDLDWTREGGGWNRIQYVCEQLVLNGVPRSPLLEVTDKEGRTSVLSDSGVASIGQWDLTDTKSRDAWRRSLEGFGVFFCKPLDLDLLMLQYFTEAYKKVAGHSGPKFPKAEKDREQYFEEVVKIVAGKNASAIDFDDYDKDLLAWYRYLFLGLGKPTTHLSAIASLTRKELSESCPPVLKRLCKAIRKAL
jgi:putative ATP-dependent endonuclease of OLD family